MAKNLAKSQGRTSVKPMPKVPPVPRMTHK